MMNPCVLARPIHSTPLNGLEYLLDADGEPRVFASIEEAKALIRRDIFPDSTDEEIEGYFRFLNPEQLKQNIEEDVIQQSLTQRKGGSAMTNPELEELFNSLLAAANDYQPDEMEPDEENLLQGYYDSPPTETEPLIEAIGSLAHFVGDNFPDMADEDEKDELLELLDQAQKVREVAAT